MPSNEPAITVGLITTAVTAILALLVSFGLPITDAQQVAILAVIAGVFPLVTALLIRRKVVPSGQVVVKTEQTADGVELTAGDASPLTTGLVLNRDEFLGGVSPARHAA